MVSVIILAGGGLVALFFMPREKNKKQRPRRDVFKGFDDYALLYTLLSQRRYSDLLKTVKKIGKHSNPDKKIVLKKFETLVKKCMLFHK